MGVGGSAAIEVGNQRLAHPVVVDVDGVAAPRPGCLHQVADPQNRQVAVERREAGPHGAGHHLVSDRGPRHRRQLEHRPGSGRQLENPRPQHVVEQ